MLYKSYLLLLLTLFFIIYEMSNTYSIRHFVYILFFIFSELSEREKIEGNMFKKVTNNVCIHK